MLLARAGHAPTRHGTLPALAHHGLSLAGRPRLATRELARRQRLVVRRPAVDLPPARAAATPAVGRLG